MTHVLGPIPANVMSQRYIALGKQIANDIRKMSRSLLSALVVTVLVTALATGECVSCGIGAATSSEKGGCCTPDGRCRLPYKMPPMRCLQGHVEGTLVEQAEQMHPAAVYLQGPELIEPVFQQDAIPAPTLTRYSPPDLCILNAAFLI